jgi:hypothetical protein
MELPNYFFVDLPSEAGLSHDLVLEACRSLKRNRLKYLANRSTDSIIDFLANIAVDWLDPTYPLRQIALEQGPEKTRFSRAVLERGLNEFFERITPDNLRTLITQDLGHPQRLDQFVSSEAELRDRRASMAIGPELLAHITGGVLPNPTLITMMLGLLARSAQFIKCASGSSFLPRLFGHSLYLRESKLASCLEIAEWKGGNDTLESALFLEANCVTFTGSNEGMVSVRGRVPAQVRFVPYGNKLSFAFVTREMLSRVNLRRTLHALAADIAAWDQLGCLSPHLIYVESGGALSPVQFSESFAEELERAEQSWPRGKLETEEASAIALRRMFYQVRAADAENTRTWFSQDSTAWSIVYEEDPQFQQSCLNRFIYVKGVAGVEHILRLIASLEGQISTVGLCAPADRGQAIATQLARAGVTRICPAGSMQNPSLSWRHDGRPSLGDLVTWADFEMI